MYWKPIQQAKDKVKRANKSKNPRLKWEYQCEHCKDWFAAKQIEVDHKVEAGSLRCSDDLKGFVERLFAEDGYQVLCKDCHNKKTHQ